MARQQEQAVEIDGRRIRISHPDKVLYPSGFTEAEVVDFHLRIAPTIVPVVPFEQRRL